MGDRRGVVPGVCTTATPRDESTPTRPSPRTDVVPRLATLDGFAEAAAAGAGVSVWDLDPLTVLYVTTYNSRYTIMASSRADVFVQGGQFFPVLCAARFSGSTFGGSMLKTGWIGVGMHMEICGDEGPIVTSPVVDIRIERPSAGPAH